MQDFDDLQHANLVMTWQSHKYTKHKHILYSSLQHCQFTCTSTAHKSSTLSTH